MRIAILQTPTFHLNLDYHGGIERVELGQLEFLADQGHRARLYVPALVGEHRAIKVIADWGWRSRWLKWKYYLEFIARTRWADVRWGHYTPLLALLSPHNAVVHFHGLSVRELSFYRYPWARRRYHRAHYVFCSRWVKEEFEKLYPDIPKDRLHVLYNGVDVVNFFHQPQLSLSERAKICWYGLWEEEKGIYQLLEAVSILEQRRNDFMVHIGGSAAYEGITEKSKRDQERVIEWVRRLKTVNLVGPIARSWLPDFLKDFQLGLFPSIYQDPFPLVPLEMMAAGLPVIAYDLGGPKEAIIDGHTGLLVENKRPDLLAERIEWFLDHRQAIAEMGRNARRHVEESFSLEKHGQGLIEICQKVVKG